MLIKLIMKQYLVCVQWKTNTATGKTVTLKGCQKQVGREGLSGLVLIFLCSPFILCHMRKHL